MAQGWLSRLTVSRTPRAGSAGLGLVLHQVPHRVAFVLLVAWEELELRGQVGVVSRNYPHTPRTAVPTPQSKGELQQPSS